MISPNENPPSAEAGRVGSGRVGTVILAGPHTVVSFGITQAEPNRELNRISCDNFATGSGTGYSPSA